MIFRAILFLFLPFSHFACLYFILSPPLSVPQSKVKAKYLNEKSESKNLNEKEECASQVLRVKRWPNILCWKSFGKISCTLSELNINFTDFNHNGYRLVNQMLLFS